MALIGGRSRVATGQNYCFLLKKNKNKTQIQTENCNVMTDNIKYETAVIFYRTRKSEIAIQGGAHWQLSGSIWWLLLEIQELQCRKDEKTGFMEIRPFTCLLI